MGAQQILDAILEEARRDAAALMAEADAAARDTLENARREAARRAEEMAEKSRAEAAEDTRRAMLAAELAARKASLASRRELLDSVFDGAVEALCAMPYDKSAAFITALAVACAETGREKLQVPKQDLEKYTKPLAGQKQTLLEHINAALARAGKPGELTLDSETGDFRGGVRLIGEKTDIDCSFESLVAAYRENHEAEISARLFGEKEG